MFSRSAGYAIEALTHLAAQPSGKLTGAREIAEEAGILMPFLWKILRNLSQKKLVRSFKGVRGGYELARAPEKISMSGVLAASPDARHSDECVLGRDGCSDAHPCPLHFSWQGVRSQIDESAEGNYAGRSGAQCTPGEVKRSQQHELPETQRPGVIGAEPSFSNHSSVM